MKYRKKDRPLRILIYVLAIIAAVAMMIFLIDRAPFIIGELTSAAATTANNTEHLVTTSKPAEKPKSGNPDLLVLVNSEHKFQNRESGLVSIYDYKTKSYLVKDTNVKVDKRIMTPLNEMMDAFYNATGKNDVNIISGYRSIESQKDLYEEIKQQYGSSYAKRFCQKPGSSEHHTGLAVDFAIYHTSTGVSEDFKGQGDYAWFYENSYKYGFIRRYEEDKESLTGIGYEPWHFRYVGKKAAKEMKESGMCLEEYVANN